MKCLELEILTPIEFCKTFHASLHCGRQRFRLFHPIFIPDVFHNQRFRFPVVYAFNTPCKPTAIKYGQNIGPVFAFYSRRINLPAVLKAKQGFKKQLVP